MELRWRIIKDYCKNKEVLDFGCIGDYDLLNYRPLDRGEGIFNLINKISKLCIGIDYNKVRVEELNKDGYKNIIYGNAETIKLNKKFDIVFAGELIEHLSNQGLFLDNVKKHLKKKGLFILTTPNTFSFNHLIRGLVLGDVKPYPEHSLWHNHYTLKEVLRRYGLKIIKEVYYTEKDNGIKSMILRFMGRFRKKWNLHILLICKIEK